MFIFVSFSDANVRNKIDMTKEKTIFFPQNHGFLPFFYKKMVNDIQNHSPSKSK